MRLGWEPITLRLKQPFRIAHQSSETRDNVLVHVDSGVGEAAGVTYLGESSASIVRYLAGIDPSALGDPRHLDAVLARLPAGSSAARAGFDIALHDRFGQELGQPLYRLLGLDPERIPLTSFTLGMDEPDALARAAKNAALPILKLKLGDARDADRVSAVRAATSSSLRVDANTSWSVERAQALLPRLAELGVELVEQPLAVGDLEGLRALRKVEPRPLVFADESIRTRADILAHRDLVDGVVIKLMKCGGLREAVRQITLAHALDLEVMLGCAVESSVAVTAAAHIAPLVERVDLDGPWLIANDPYLGVRYEGAKLVLPTAPGLGVTRRAP